METIAYLQLAQEHENPEAKTIQFSTKTVATAVTVASTAWAGGLLTSAPAIAYNYGCCRPRPIVVRPIVVRPVDCCRPVVQRPVDCCRPVVHRPLPIRPISSCSSSCYPQARPYQHDSGSYYPDYYSQNYDYGYEDDYGYEPDYGHDQGGYDEISYHPVVNENLLQLGSKGEIVALLQQALLDQGFDPGPVDGFFGPATESAVIHFQSAAGLSVDGVAGGQTLDSLGLAGFGA